jgi:hypothetical protein
MTRYEKLAISLPLRAAETARRAVKTGKASSVSAYVARAIEEQAKLDEADLFAEMLAETGGPLTAAEKRRADREMALATRRWTAPTAPRRAAAPRRRR